MDYSLMVETPPLIHSNHFRYSNPDPSTVGNNKKVYKLKGNASISMSNIDSRPWKSVCKSNKGNSLISKNRKLPQALDWTVSKSHIVNPLNKRSSVQLDELIKDNAPLHDHYEVRMNSGTQGQKLFALNQRRRDNRRISTSIMNRHKLYNLSKARNNKSPLLRAKKTLSLSPLIKSIQLPNIHLYNKIQRQCNKQPKRIINLQEIDSLNTSIDISKEELLIDAAKEIDILPIVAIKVRIKNKEANPIQ